MVEVEGLFEETFPRDDRQPGKKGNH